VDPALSARESDRGRLTVGQRADLAVIQAAAIDEPVTPGGVLSSTRPRLVFLDGEVAFEA
jgi:predicted amidohydrolase YtcJ